MKMMSVHFKAHYFFIFFFMYEAVKYCNSDPILILCKAFTYGLLYALCVKESDNMDRVNPDET